MEKEEKGDLEIYRLSDNKDQLQIDVNPGKEYVAYFKSRKYDFKDLVKDKDSRNEIKDKLQEKLDFKITGNVKLAGLFEEEFSLVLLDDSTLSIGEKWTEEETQIYP